MLYEVITGHLSEDKNPEAVAEDIRFTTNNGNLYAIMLDWPQNHCLIKSFAPSEKLLTKKIKTISLLGSTQELEWKLTDQGLDIVLPEKQPCDHAQAIKIQFH